MKFTAFVCFCLLSILPGCSGRSHILPPEKFQDVYERLLVSALDTGKVGIPQRLAEKRVEDILKESQVTREEYLATLEWYNSDRNRWKEFTEKVAEHLQEETTPKPF